MRWWILPVLLLALAPTVPAQPVPLTAEFTAVGVDHYEAAIPTPDDVLGHTIGERHTRPDEVLRYFEAVAAASDRVTFGRHAVSHEGRPLFHAIVTAPGVDHEAVRLENLAISDNPNGISGAQLEVMPLVAYMGYSVHGDEASGTEAAMLLLYHLAAGQGPAVEEVLRNVVVIIDPMLNPDGRARFVNWANSNRSGSAAFASLDGQDREHRQPWPRGRTNRYLFDLNRDWLPLVHPESRGRTELWHHWRPQVTGDFHEMGSNTTYFFQPGIPSRNNPHTPERNYELTRWIAEHHARALDRIGQPYYTRESFDDFYLGKGSSYPDVQGSVGILFEQASSRSLATETVHGRLDYGTTVRNQFATSLSTLAGAVEHRTELLEFQRETYAGAADLARQSRVAAWVMDASPDPVLANEFVDLLNRHRIEVHALDQHLDVDGHRFEGGSAFVVPVDQPQARFITAVMERAHTFTDSLFYDVSTWPLPLAFGLPHAELDRVPRLGAAIDGWTADARLHGGHGEIAYILPWTSTAAAAHLYRIQQKGIPTRVMREAFTAVGAGWTRDFAAGAVVIHVPGDGEMRTTLRAAVDDITAAGIDVYSVGSGLSLEGPDLSGPSSTVLSPPRVAILSGEGTNVAGVGEAWHLLTERVEMPVSLVDLASLSSFDLQRYDRIVLAGQPWGQTANGAASALLEWMQTGGVLILTGTATGWAAENGLIDLAPREATRDSVQVSFGDAAAHRGRDLIGGAVFEVELDSSHPVAFGFGGPVAVFKQGAQAFDPPVAPTFLPGRYTDAPRLSGYVSDTNIERIREGAAIVTGSNGRGAVVAFDFAPAFRGFWRGSERLLVNAVFFGDALRTGG